MRDTNKEIRNALEAQLITLQQWHQREENEPVKEVLAKRMELTVDALRDIALRSDDNLVNRLHTELKQLQHDLREMPYAAGKIQAIIETIVTAKP